MEVYLVRGAINMTKQKPTQITFKSIYSGKQETYGLSWKQSLTNARCPIEGTRLVAYDGTTSRPWETREMYKCPNCGYDYYHLEPKKLNFAKQIIVEERKKKLAELRAQESYIVKLLEAAGEKLDY